MDSNLQSSLFNGSPDEMLEAMLLIMKNLKTLYEVERKAIDLKKLKEFSALQPEKQILMQHFEIGLKAIKAKGESIKSANPKLREEIITLQAELDALALYSQSWSERMVESIKRMQERLIKAGRAAIEDTQKLYTPKGVFKHSMSRVQATAINSAF